MSLHCCRPPARSMFEFTLFFFLSGLLSGIICWLCHWATGLLALALALPLHDRRSDGPMRHERACVDGCRHFSGPSEKRKTQKSKNTLLYKSARLTDQAANTGSRIDTGGVCCWKVHFLFPFLFFIFLDCHYHRHYSSTRLLIPSIRESCPNLRKIR